MGIVKKILSYEKIDPVAVFYSDHLTVELAENFHFHWRNLRFEMDHAEFEELYHLFSEAYSQWEAQDKPPIGDRKGTGALIVLAKTKANPVAGSRNQSIAGDEIRVEVQKWADYIHIHWKWMRMELTFAEFLEFSDLIKEAANSLRSASWFENAPRRLGKFHVACPRDRVSHLDPTGEFWTSRGQDKALAHPHKTTYLDPNDARQKGHSHRLTTIVPNCSSAISQSKRLYWWQTLKSSLWQRLSHISLKFGKLRLSLYIDS